MTTRDPADPRHELSPIHTFGLAIQAREPGLRAADLDAPALRALVREHHLVLLRGFTAFETAQELSDFSAGFGEVAVWPFGTVLELVEHDQPEDHIFDHSHVPMHWDGMYREQVPEFQVFQCVLAPGDGDGGETTFADTAGILRALDPETRERWAKVTGTYRREMAFYKSVTDSPVVTPHPVTGVPVLRYNEPVDPGDTSFVNHPDLAFTGLPEAELAAFHKEIREALYAPEHFHAHTWQTGDLVLTDNYTLLHGRNAFTAHAPRHLRRVHVLGEPPLTNPGLRR
ncbi:alpha-ketoglutarate-dependent taurine dioxygenase [Crossiella equi]|uniref:Alpha-ketoglutarate-dependent taurine dioxygenase n=1 Tax=Crossiella equi TaxID=130796 RepID=A0ABS5A9Y2_9PSEU|nr:TauD/TfdA family dioxygenase [Crossiella equi]MBP2472555.1 alpha-ketoglutarate-dependent taurine dioxygenase [Crossiella equi]